MNFKRVVDHFVKQKFLTLNFDKFLGDAPQNRIEQEWIRSYVTQNSNALLINREPILNNQINVELVKLFLSAQSFMGSCSSLSLASITNVEKDSRAIEDVTSLSDLIEALPQTHLNLCNLTQPAHKNDEFIRLQKTRRRSLVEILSSTACSFQHYK